MVRIVQRAHILVDKPSRVTGQIVDHFGKLLDRVFARVADIHRLVLRRHEQPVDALDQIGDILKRAGLQAIAIGCQRLTSQRLLDKVRHNAAIAQAHARAIRVEDAYNARIDAMKGMVGHGDRLSETLGFIVDTTRADRIDIAVVALILRVNLRVAIDLGCRGEQEARALILGQSQHLMRAERADFQRLDWQLQVINWG